MAPGKVSVVLPASVLDADFSVAVARTGRPAPNGSVPSLPHGSSGVPPVHENAMPGYSANAA